MIPRYCSKLLMDFKQEKCVRMCVSKINSDYEMRTMNPLTKIATGMNVATAGEWVAEISTICGVSGHTITRSTVRYNTRH